MPWTAATRQQAAVGAFAASTDFYVSLHSADPGTTGANAITAPGRQSTQFSGSDGALDNDSALQWTNVQTEPTHFGVWTASSGGTFKAGGDITGISGFSAGDTIDIAAGALDLTVPAS